MKDDNGQYYISDDNSMIHEGTTYSKILKNDLANSDEQKFSWKGGDDDEFTLVIKGNTAQVLFNGEVTDPDFEFPNFKRE